MHNEHNYFRIMHADVLDYNLAVSAQWIRVCTTGWSGGIRVPTVLGPSASRLLRQGGALLPYAATRAHLSQMCCLTSEAYRQLLLGSAVHRSVDHGHQEILRKI